MLRICVYLSRFPALVHLHVPLRTQPLRLFGTHKERTTLIFSGRHARKHVPLLLPLWFQLLTLVVFHALEYVATEGEVEPLKTKQARNLKSSTFTRMDFMPIFVSQPES